MDSTASSTLFPFLDHVPQSMIRCQDFGGEISISHWTYIVRGEPTFNRGTLVAVSKGAYNRVNHDLVGDWADEMMGRFHSWEEGGCDLTKYHLWRKARVIFSC